MRDQVAILSGQLAELEKSPGSTNLRELTAVHMRLGGALLDAGRIQDGLDAFSWVIERCGEADDPSIRLSAGLALYLSAEAMYGREDWSAGDDALAEIRRRFSDDADLAVRALALTARAKEASMLAARGRFLEALAVYDDVLSRVPTAQEQDRAVHFERAVAQALAEKAEVLRKLNRSGEALATYSEFLRRHSNSSDREVRSWLCVVLPGKASVLFHSELYESALDTVDDLLVEFAGDLTADREALADAVLTRTASLMNLGRDEEALTSNDEFVNRYWNDASLPQRRRALGLGAWIRRRLGRPAEALQLYDRALEITDGLSPHSVAFLALRRAEALTDLDRHDEARLALEDIVARGHRDADEGMVELVAQAREVLDTLDSQAE